MDEQIDDFERFQPESSNIRELAHDGGERLEVTFMSGDRYRYWPVPHRVFKALCEASSAGRKFRSLVKGKYKFMKVSENEGA